MFNELISIFEQIATLESSTSMGKKDRMLSIDFLRGITVAAMILVNNPGSWSFVYAPLNHAHWNGCTVTDLVFPYFLFIMGVSIHLSLSKVKDDNKKAIVIKILKRSLILFSLGLFLNAFPFIDFENLRIMGVLQRIALVFGVCALLYIYLSNRAICIVTGAILIFYWIAMTLLPVPGIGHPDLNPGTNMAAWVDGFVLKGHIWSQTRTWDPEGLFSTLPAIASGLIGVLFGGWIDLKIVLIRKLMGLFCIGGILILLGSLWSYDFPINKSLWTSSYVLFTSGIAIVVSTAFYWLLDIKKVVFFSDPFLAFGSNAIVVYMVSELLAKILYTIKFSFLQDTPSVQEFVYEQGYKSWLNPYNASLGMAITMVMICFVPIWILYKKQIFIKV
jgi:predicted acyltransferase